MYYFYLQYLTQITTAQVVSSLSTSFTANPAFVSAGLPLYSAIRVDSINNNYQPLVQSANVSVSNTYFNLSVEVGLVNSYLIAAVMSTHF